MIRRPDLILIGASARKTGKTLYVCRLIARESTRREVIGLKITPWHEEGREPGAVSPPGAGFTIREETEPSPEHDTGRMLAAGAARALWLRTDSEHLAEGLARLLADIPPGTCLVAEGNSAWREMEPGLFLVLRKPDGEEKASFRDLAPLADRIAVFENGGWNPAPEECLFLDGAWCLKPRASAIVLAGGDSTRMGSDKALLLFAGKPLIAHIVDRLSLLFDDVVIGGGRPGDYDFLGREVVPDRAPGQGPLMGIASALERTKSDLNLVVACDMPNLPLAYAARLAAAAEGYEAVLPMNAAGELEPLFAYYRKNTAAPARELLAAGARSILDLLPRIRTRTVPIPGGIAIRNINTREDYERLMGGGM
jgi:molybdopterin-guanine dinucleotide biosynthesis protein A